MQKMKLYGKEDDNFGDMGDFTEDVLIPLDFNTVMPLLQRKPAKCYSICETNLNNLLDTFKKKLTKIDSRRDLIILMRIKTKSNNTNKFSKLGWKISSLMSEDSLVTWAAQRYSRYRFDFYFYDKPRFKTIVRYDLLKKIRN
jgi:hypothetical protein